MPNLDRLPGPADGTQGLLALADVFGSQQVFDLIRLCRVDQGPDKRPGSEVATILANRLVDAAGGDRAGVADDLGYTPTTRTNFYKILDGVARRSLGRGGK